MPKVSKASVNYRKQSYQWGRRKCANCSMFVRGKPGNRPAGACTLVAGVIRPQDICDRWEAK